MTRHRFLGSAGSPPGPVSADSDYVVILAALLCALICVLGLIAVARCAWLRRLSSPSSFTASAGGAPPPPPPPPPSKANKGLKKKILRSLPKLTFTPNSAARFSDCTICLAEFADGDEIRVLPHCGHAFHVACIDPWLGSHSSCPSCRRILVAATVVCDKCGSLPATTPSSSSISGTAEEESRMKQREDHNSRLMGLAINDLHFPDRVRTLPDRSLSQSIRSNHQSRRLLLLGWLLLSGPSVLLLLGV